jgi:predicted ATP-dependent serine protease
MLSDSVTFFHSSRLSWSSAINSIRHKDTSATLQVDLGGGLRPVRALDLRLAELAKLGLTRIIIPKVGVKL